MCEQLTGVQSLVGFLATEAGDGQVVDYRSTTVVDGGVNTQVQEFSVCRFSG